MSSYEHEMLIEVQNPHAGRTLSHFVFLARHTRQALLLLLRGYRALAEELLARFLDPEDSWFKSGPLGTVGFCSDMWTSSDCAQYLQCIGEDQACHPRLISQGNEEARIEFRCRNRVRGEEGSRPRLGCRIGARKPHSLYRLTGDLHTQV